MQEFKRCAQLVGDNCVKFNGEVLVDDEYDLTPAGKDYQERCADILEHTEARLLQQMTESVTNMQTAQAFSDSRQTADAS